MGMFLSGRIRSIEERMEEGVEGEGGVGKHILEREEIRSRASRGSNTHDVAISTDWPA